MRFLSILAVVVVMLPAVSLAQGYGGLFADDKPTTKRDEPPGYQGLVPGSTPPPAAAPAPAQKPVSKKDVQAASPKAKIDPAKPAVASGAVAPQMTEVPGGMGLSNMPKPTSSNDLRLLATMYAQDRNLDSIPDDMAAKFKMPDNMTALLATPRPRINGMLPVENSVKNSIDQAFAQMNNKNLSASDRQKQAQQLVATLKSLRQGLAIQGSIPDKTYKIMGMPDTYIKEEREATKNSLARIDAALAKFK